jgi:hypothetical protein
MNSSLTLHGVSGIILEKDTLYVESRDETVDKLELTAYAADGSRITVTLFLTEDCIITEDIT